MLGTGHFVDTGGKGANQAVAAVRLGHEVAMIGMVGADPAGDLLRSVLSREGGIPPVSEPQPDRGREWR